MVELWRTGNPSTFIWSSRPAWTYLPPKCSSKNSVFHSSDMSHQLFFGQHLTLTMQSSAVFLHQLAVMNDGTLVFGIFSHLFKALCYIFFQCPGCQISFQNTSLLFKIRAAVIGTWRFIKLLRLSKGGSIVLEVLLNISRKFILSINVTLGWMDSNCWSTLCPWFSCQCPVGGCICRPSQMDQQGKENKNEMYTFIVGNSVHGRWRQST